MSKKVFRAYDIRGHIDILDAMLVEQIGFALAQQFHQHQQKIIVVGHDARLTSPSYAKIVLEALSQSGLQVIFIGCVSSPLLYFTAKQYSGSGVMITASHNPITDNGIKWLIQGLPPSPEQIQQIANTLDLRNKSQFKGAVTSYDASMAYLNYLVSDIHLFGQPYICVEGLHGSAGEIAVKALKQLGCEVNALNCFADGVFPLGAPDPSHSERLQALKQQVIKHQATMGMALDGDGDRLVILDEQGNYISPDRLICLFAKMCLQQQSEMEIVCDVKCSTMIADTVTKYHGKFTMIRTGSSFLRNYLNQHQAIFGGEFAGHYVFNDGRGKGYDDGLYAALRLLEYLSLNQMTLSQAIAEFPERISTRDVYIPMADTNYTQFAQLLETTTTKIPVKMSKVDGIRLDFPFGFGIIRPSNTGEFFTMRFDADTSQNLQQIRQFFVEAIQPQFPEIAQAIALAD